MPPSARSSSPWVPAARSVHPPSSCTGGGQGAGSVDDLHVEPRSVDLDTPSTVATGDYDDRLMKAINASSRSLICVKDLDGRYLMVNEAYERALGVTAADLLGREADAICPALAELAGAADAAVEAGIGHPEELGPGPDGSSYDNAVKVPLYNSEGALYAICEVSLDTTEVNNANAALAAARDAALAGARARALLLAAVSPEIRTPLNSVIEMTDLLMDTDLDDRQRDLVATIRSSGDTLLGVIDDILDDSAMKSGELRARPEQLPAASINHDHEATDTKRRLERLQATNQAAVSQLELGHVLRRIVEAARELVGARYASMRVFGADSHVEQFVEVGISPHDNDPMALPHHDTQDSSRPAGLETGPPAERGFRAVPIRSRNGILGTLYLTAKARGDFTVGDEQLVMSLAATAGATIENARLHEQSEQQQEWLQASADWSDFLLSRGAGPDHNPLDRLVETVRRLAGADVVTIVMASTEIGKLQVAVASGRGSEELPGLRYDAAGSLASQVMKSGRGLRLAAADQQVRFPVHLLTVVDVGPVMCVPLTGREGPRGVITVGRLQGSRAFTGLDLEMVEIFAGHAAVALELMAHADQQRTAVLADRNRIARDLHDHVIQGLFADGLTLQTVTMTAKEPEVVDTVNQVVDHIDETIRQIRTFIFHLQREDLAERSRGLRSTVQHIAGQITPLLGFAPDVRLSGPLDAVVPVGVFGEVEAVVREGMTNVAKHAQATKVVVKIAVVGRNLTVDISDDGVGLTDNERRSGLKNLKQRAAELGGTLVIHNRLSGGTQLLWNVPVNAWR